MAQPKPTIPLTIVAGYLGAGKTTLLNQVIAQCDTSRFAILVNDFGKLNIDAELVELEGGKAFRLESGCICCNIGNGLMTALLQVLRMTPRPERVLVEASGVADPARIADIAELSPSLHPGRTIVLADSTRIKSLLADPLLAATVRKQIEASDLLVLNKADLCSDESLAALSTWLLSQFGMRPIITAQHARIPPAETLMEKDQPSQTEPDVLDETAASWAKAHDGHDGPTHAQHGEIFWSWSYENSTQFEREPFERVLRDIAPVVERAKGFIRFREAPHQLMVVQFAGADFSITKAHHDRPAMPNCRIEFIGAGKRPDESFLGRILGGASNGGAR